MINNPLLRMCPGELVTLLEKDFLFAVSEGLGLGQNHGLLRLIESLSQKIRADTVSVAVVIKP